MVDFDASVKKGVIIKAGESLKLPAVVTGRPQPEVKWAKDEGEIDKDRMIVETEGKNSSLFIKKAIRADHGKYQISGTNSSGTKTAETRVDIMGECSLGVIHVFCFAFLSVNHFAVNVTVGSSLTLSCCYVSIDVPGPVVDLKTVTVTKKNITLTWSDPLDNGGSDIIGYEVLRKDAKMKLFRQPMETASCKCDIQGLLAGEEYDFRVIARNKYGDGAPADLGPILAEDPKGKPQQFSKLKHKNFAEVL